MKTASNNIFKDFGIDNAGEKLAKANEFAAITKLIVANKYKKTILAEKLGLSKVEVDRLLMGSLKSFSLAHLVSIKRLLSPKSTPSRQHHVHEQAHSARC